MIDEGEDSGGKIDWTVAIVLSVVFHAALLGAVWMFSDKPGGKTAESASSVSAPAQARPDAPPAATTTPPPPETATPQTTTTATTTTATTPPAAPTDGAPSASAADSASAAQYGTYVVKSGDNLSRIANKCGCTVVELKKINDIKDPNSIRPGQKLKVPAQE